MLIFCQTALYVKVYGKTFLLTHLSVLSVSLIFTVKEVSVPVFFRTTWIESLLFFQWFDLWWFFRSKIISTWTWTSVISGISKWPKWIITRVTPWFVSEFFLNICIFYVFPRLPHSVRSFPQRIYVRVSLTFYTTFICFFNAALLCVALLVRDLWRSL